MLWVLSRGANLSVGSQRVRDIWWLIQRFFLLKPIFRVWWCLTLYSTCQWPQLGHLAVSFIRLVQNACLPTCEKLKIDWAENSWEWSKTPPNTPKPSEIILISSYKIPRDASEVILTIPAGRGIPRPIPLPTCMVRQAWSPRKIPGSFWHRDP